MTDTNELLERARAESQKAHRFYMADDLEAGDAHSNAVRQIFDELDDALSAGAFPPDAWRKSR